MSREDALFAARLHIEKGTLLSNEAVHDICLELSRAAAEATRLSEAVKTGGRVKYALTGGRDSLSGAFNAGVDAVLEHLRSALAGEVKP